MVFSIVRLPDVRKKDVVSVFVLEGVIDVVSNTVAEKVFIISRNFITAIGILKVVEPNKNIWVTFERIILERNKRILWTNSFSTIYMIVVSPY